MWKLCLNILVVASNNLQGSSPLLNFAQCGEDEVVWEKLPKCANSKCWTHQGWKMAEICGKCTDGGCTDSITHFLSRITEIELCRTPLCHYLFIIHQRPHSLKIELEGIYKNIFFKLICNFSAAFLSFFSSVLKSGSSKDMKHSPAICRQQSPLLQLGNFL